MKEIRSEKNRKSYIGRRIALLLTCALTVQTMQIGVYAGNLADTARESTSEAASIERLAWDDCAGMPQGMLPAMELTEEGANLEEVSPEMAAEIFDEEGSLAAETEMEADLLARFEAQPDEVIVLSEDSVSVNQVEEITPEQLGYATIDAAANYLRDQLVKRKNRISVRVAKGPDSSQQDIKKIFMQAATFYDGCKPNEGDYIFWHIFGAPTYRSSSSSKAITYEISIDWLAGAAEESWVDAKLGQVITQLDLKNPQKSEYEKVSQIYDFIMDTLDYDTFHYTNFPTTYKAMYCPYGALSSGKGVCQAYALIFYRLCMEAGIEARLISGNDENGVAKHGWNIVRIGEVFYNVDATWDDEVTSHRDYFLKNTADFSGHSRHDDSNTSAFHKRFPMAEFSYSLPGRQLTAANNIAEQTLKDRRGKTVSNKSAGKAKVLVFQNGTMRSYLNMIVCMYGWSLNGRSDCDIVILDLLPPQIYEQRETSAETYADNVEKVLSSATNLSYVMYSDANVSLRKAYAQLCGGTAQTTPCCVLIDANNQVRYYGEGFDCATEAELAFGELGRAAYGLSGLSCVQTKNNQVKLSWNPVAGTMRYYVYRTNGNGEYSCVGTTAATNYVNQIPGAGTYSYRVFASDGNQFLANSAPVSAACQVIYHKKGQVLTQDGYKYKVLSSSASKKTVAFAGISKTMSRVYIPSSVCLDGHTYQVTEVAAKALRNKKNIVTVSVGKNVTKIGAQAFSGCKKLSQIVLQGTKIKKVGKKAFQKTAKKAVVYVPAASYNKYRRLLKKKGLSAKAVIKK